MIRMTISCRSVTGLSIAVKAATPTNRTTPPTHIMIAVIDLRFELHVVDARVHDRGDHECDRPERLHHDERCEVQAGELEDDREPEHDRAEHPGRPGEQQHQLPRVQPLAERVGGVRLDLHDAAVLELRAQREEHRADQRERDPDERRRIERDLLGEVGQGLHATTLPGDRPISLPNGRSPHSNHR